MNESQRPPLRAEAELTKPTEIPSCEVAPVILDKPRSEPLYFDGGDTGCGELLLDLLLFMRPHPPGAQAVIRALDSGAPLEIPAWCRLTGHRVLQAGHPLYLIQKLPQETQEKK